MDNVLNRPLFRHREARDRLNDIAGVQRFQEGGPVRPEGLMSLRDVLQSGLGTMMPMAIPMAMASEQTGAGNATGVMEALNEKLSDPNLRANERRALENQRSALSFAIEAGYGAADAVTDALSVLQSLGTRGIEYGVAPVVSAVSPDLGEMIYDQIPMFDATAEELALMGQAVPSNLRPSDTPKNVAFEAAGRGTPPLRPAASGMEAEARDSRPRGGLLPTPGPTPESAFAGPSGMEQEARGRGPMTPALGPSGMEQEARGRGPLITDPAAVAAGLNAEDPAIREKTTADFMKEYTDAAPKYEGMDKGLLLAQIGFAIAAGESPNAMQNIANGLLAGSDMMLKDKAAKDEFDRQIQLAAMQYGFGESAQERALGRQFTNYVANDTVKYRGKTYKPGESVPVIHSDIINGRMPGGIVTEGTSDALIASDAAIRKSMAEALKGQKLEPAAYRAAIETLDTAASDYSSARNLMPLLEASLVRSAQGEVTGIDAALTRKMNEVMNAFNLQPPAEYESPEAFESALRQVSVTMVQDLLGESGKTISDADRRLIDGLIGLQQDIVSGVIKDPDILTRKVQELMRVLESKQQNALDVYSTAMEGYGGTYTPSGTPVRSLRAERVFDEAQAPAIQYEWDQATNRLVRKKNEG